MSAKLLVLNIYMYFIFNIGRYCNFIHFWLYNIIINIIPINTFIKKKNYNFFIIIYCYYNCKLQK